MPSPSNTDQGITTYLQGCGLGLNVSVSRRARDVPTSRLGLVSRKIVSVSVLSRSREADVSVSSRLGLGHVRLVPKTNFRPSCAGHSTQCERALDVVSLCCSYYCSSYKHAVTLQLWFINIYFLFTTDVGHYCTFRVHFPSL